MTRWLTELPDHTPVGQWLVYGAMVITVTFALLRTAGNLREIRRLGQRRGRYYAIRIWRASAGPLRIFLVTECLVVDAVSVLVLLVLGDVTLW
ncbi:hypothetical protein BSU01_22580 [Erwinia billingiae]|nr:hypothetical protein [Erwinia billingiae]